MFSDAKKIFSLVSKHFFFLVARFFLAARIFSLLQENKCVKKKKSRGQKRIVCHYIKKIFFGIRKHFCE